jgi:hypothetical protein
MPDPAFPDYWAGVVLVRPDMRPLPLREVPGLHAWRCGRTVSSRAVAYAFYAEGVLAGIPAVDRYLTHPFDIEV